MQDWGPSSRCRSEHSAAGDAVSRKRGLAGPNGVGRAVECVAARGLSQVTVPRVVVCVASRPTVVYTWVGRYLHPPAEVTSTTTSKGVRHDRCIRYISLWRQLR